MRRALLGTLEGDRVRCGLCPHACLIAEGGRGWCGARGVEDGELRALTYGLVSSIAVDPIEKKPVFDYWSRRSTCSRWGASAAPCGVATVRTGRSFEAPRSMT